MEPPTKKQKLMLSTTTMMSGGFDTMMVKEFTSSPQISFAIFRHLPIVDISACSLSCSSWKYFTFQYMTDMFFERTMKYFQQYPEERASTFGGDMNFMTEQFLSEMRHHIIYMLVAFPTLTNVRVRAQVQNAFDFMLYAKSARMNTSQKLEQMIPRIYPLAMLMSKHSDGSFQASNTVQYQLYPSPLRFPPPQTTTANKKFNILECVDPSIKPLTNDREQWLKQLSDVIGPTITTPQQQKSLGIYGSSTGLHFQFDPALSDTLGLYTNLSLRGCQSKITSQLVGNVTSDDAETTILKTVTNLNSLHQLWTKKQCLDDLLSQFLHRLLTDVYKNREEIIITKCMKEVAFTALMDVFGSKDSNISSLTLVNSRNFQCLTKDQARLLSNSLRKNSSLKTLTVMGSWESDQITSIMTALHGHKSLKTLEFSVEVFNGNMTPRMFGYAQTSAVDSFDKTWFLRHISLPPMIESLELRYYNPIGMSQHPQINLSVKVSYLVDERLKNLKQLAICCPISQNICSLIRGNESLKELKLQSISATDGVSWFDFYSSIMCCQSLESIDLDYSTPFIFSESRMDVILFFECLPKLTQLRSLTIKVLRSDCSAICHSLCSYLTKLQKPLSKLCIEFSGHVQTSFFSLPFGPPRPPVPVVKSDSDSTIFVAKLLETMSCSAGKEQETRRFTTTDDQTKELGTTIATSTSFVDHLSLLCLSNEDTSAVIDHITLDTRLKNLTLEASGSYDEIDCIYKLISSKTQLQSLSLKYGFINYMNLAKALAENNTLERVSVSQLPGNSLQRDPYISFRFVLGSMTPFLSRNKTLKSLDIIVQDATTRRPFEQFELLNPVTPEHIHNLRPSLVFQSLEQQIQPQQQYQQLLTPFGNPLQPHPTMSPPLKTSSWPAPLDPTVIERLHKQLSNPQLQSLLMNTTNTTLNANAITTDEEFTDLLEAFRCGRFDVHDHIEYLNMRLDKFLTLQNAREC